MNSRTKDFPFFYQREVFDENGLMTRCESYDKQSGKCYLVIKYFYDEHHRLIQETQDVDNEVERSHTEAIWTYPGDWWLRESTTHYEFSALGLRDERCIERYKDAIMIRDTFDLQTGEKIDHEAYEGERELDNHCDL